MHSESGNHPNEGKMNEEGLDFLGNLLQNDREFLLSLKKIILSVFKKRNIEDRHFNLDEEILHDLVIKILSGGVKQEIKTREEAISYCRRAISNNIYDWLRGDGRLARRIFPSADCDNYTITQALDTEPSFPMNEPLDIDDLLERNQVRTMFENGQFEELEKDERKKEIFRLRTYEEKGCPEIAKILIQKGYLDKNKYDITIKEDLEKASDLVRKVYDKIVETIKKQLTGEK